MQTVAQLHCFNRAAAAAGLSDTEIETSVSTLAMDPAAGVEIASTGGCRKVRFAGRGKGKSGGYRIVTFFSGEAMPLFLITVFSKGERANLTKAECNQLKELTKEIVDVYRNKVAAVAKRGA